MIAKVSRGWGIGGLIRYLMGPGRFNEHTDPRVVASWDGAPAAHQPPVVEDQLDTTRLVEVMSQPAVAAGVALREPERDTAGKVPRGPVWHCSLRNHATDRVLSDAEWAGVVEELMDRTGIAARGDLGGCRWVAVRHAPDHVHVAAMLIRQDNGRRVHPRNDFLRAREVCQAAEARLGLTATAAADRTAVEAPGRAELEKAERRGVDEPSRVWLRRAVRVAAVQAQAPEAFFRRLHDLGVLVRPKEMPPGELVGYAVAAPGDVTAEGLPVWYSGRKLARDLSLPQLVARWRSAQPPQPAAPDLEPGVDAAVPPSSVESADDRTPPPAVELERAAAVDSATSAIEHATAAVAAGEGEESEGIVHGAGDMATAICAGTARDASPVPWPVADSLDRAARTAGVGQPTGVGAVGADLRRAAWLLAAVRGLGGRGGGNGVPELMLAFAALVAEIAAYHDRQRHPAQAAAARRSGALLREAREGVGQSAMAPDVLRRDSSGPGRTPRPPGRAGTLTTNPITDGRRGRSR